MFQTKVIKKIKIHILCSVTFFPPEIELFVRYVGKYYRTGQTTDGNALHYTYVALSHVFGSCVETHML